MLVSRKYLEPAAEPASRERMLELIAGSSALVHLLAGELPARTYVAQPLQECVIGIARPFSPGIPLQPFSKGVIQRTILAGRFFPGPANGLLVRAKGNVLDQRRRSLLHYDSVH